MNLEEVKLSQLRALVAVATYGNFSEAALSLSISQSAVSHAIATLENQLGVILLYRGRHGATVTPVGDRILTYAKDMLLTLEKIGKAADLSKGLQGGQVRIAAFRSISTHILPDIISEFRATYPAITIAITEYRGDQGVEQALREGRADIAFTCLPPEEDFESWELLSDEYIVLLPPGIDQPSDPLSWDQLLQYPLIASPANDYCSIIHHDYFAQNGKTVTPAYEIVEDSTIVSMVVKGLGITIIARLAAEPLPPQVQVRQLPVPLTRTIRVATLKGALHSPPVYAFLDRLKQHTPAIQSKADRLNAHRQDAKLPQDAIALNRSNKVATFPKSLSPGADSTPLERSTPSG
ncbi:MAG: LysR family transcriptional regulator [Oculatellaceae cyanobacterium Prado106]|jgi:DNA-binding transcriptional LysR family regulator|nr:LysR family transcriptional regulator [Oculatellaceae cyanobacterium Prado106]